MTTTQTMGTKDPETINQPILFLHFWQLLARWETLVYVFDVNVGHSGTFLQFHHQSQIS